MRKKIFAPVFATAVALSASIVSYANPADYSQQNQDVEKDRYDRNTRIPGCKI